MKQFVRSIAFASLCLFSISSLAHPPIWDSHYGPNTGLVGDDDYIEMTLGFMFPFEGTDYDTVSINTNGGIVLGIDNEFAGEPYVDYDIWYDSEFEIDFTDIGDPVILPFGTDLTNDGFNATGTIHFKTDATSAVITWANMPSLEDDSVPFINFQVTLAADGTITLGYDGILGYLVSGLSEGIVVGVSNGLGDVPPGSSDLSGGVNIDVNAMTVYEIWCYDEAAPGGVCYDQSGRPDNSGFDLDQLNVIFTPNALGGLDVANVAGPVARPPLVVVTRDSNGCTVGPSDGMIDPTLPLLILISLVYLLRRRLSGT